MTEPPAETFPDADTSVTEIVGVPVNPCAVDAVPVTSPVTLPVTLPVTAPVKLPINVVAVTTPVTFPSPVTVKADVGFVVPTPTLDKVLIPILVFAHLPPM